MDPIRLLVMSTTMSALLSAGAVAGAQDNPGTDAIAASRGDEATRTEAVAAAARPRAGVLGALDPVTGELVEPTLAEPGEFESTPPPLDATAPQDFNQTWLEARPDGRVRAHLGDQFQMAAFARIDPDGKVASWCEPAGSEASEAAGLDHVHPHASSSTSAPTDDAFETRATVVGSR